MLRFRVQTVAVGSFAAKAHVRFANLRTWTVFLVVLHWVTQMDFRYTSEPQAARSGSWHEALSPPGRFVSRPTRWLIECN